MNDTKLPHILTTSANLLGICFFIITGIHITNNQENLEVMRSVAVVSLLLLLSIFLSYLSMRAHATKRAAEFERAADYLFLASIVLLFVTISMLAFGIGIF